MSDHFGQEMIRRALEAQGAGYQLPADFAYGAQQAPYRLPVTAPSPLIQTSVAGSPPVMAPNMDPSYVPLTMPPPATAAAPAPPLGAADASPDAQVSPDELMGMYRQLRPAGSVAARPGTAPQQDMAAAQGRILGSFDARAAQLDAQAGARAELDKSRSDLSVRANEADQAEVRKMELRAEAHNASLAAVENEQRGIASFIENYEPTDRRTTQQHVAGMLAVALSGIADAIAAGGGNQTNHLASTMSMIDRSVDLDMQRQEAMLRNKQTALAAKNTELGQMRAKFADGEDALAAARALKLSQYSRELDALKQRGASQEASAAIDAMKLELGVKKDEMLYGIAERRYKQSMAAAGPTIDQQLDRERKAVEIALKKQELEGGGKAAETADQKKAAIATDSALATIDRIKALSAEHPVARGVPMSAAAKQLTVMKNTLKLALNKAAAAGALDSSTLELYDQMVGDPASWVGNSAQLDQLATELRSQRAITSGDPAGLAALRGKKGAAP